MTWKNSLQILGSSLFLTAAFAPAPARAEDPVKEVRLYAIECGRIDFKDMGSFADTGEYDGKPGTLTVSCYLIRHPKGTLLWDTGLSDKLAENKAGDGDGYKFSVARPLIDQLKSIGVTPADVTHVAFSHFHVDHTGNANAFGASTWIINKAEMAWAESTPTPYGVDPKTFSSSKTVKTKLIDGDFDVFGDGSVRILKTPGHTPGHGVLEVKLKKSGVVILSGDLYHTHENRLFKRVPAFNYERADTLASIDRVEKIVKNTKAHFIVQHDRRDVATLPKFPAYLE
ncbi:MAG TPA: N-acyl homoserine lactonase family protein [Myxococcales bacterium]|nr:N-acyl homoserine lactonase family protein [Myxococcales bacterium]